MKFPAALLTNPSIGPVAQMRSIISSTAVATRISTCGHRPAGRGAFPSLPGRVLQHAAAPAADDAIGAQPDELLHHDAAQAGAAAGDEKRLPLNRSL